jgi:hypothetical protein
MTKLHLLFGFLLLAAVFPAQAHAYGGKDSGHRITSIQAPEKINVCSKRYVPYHLKSENPSNHPTGLLTSSLRPGKRLKNINLASWSRADPLKTFFFQSPDSAILLHGAHERALSFIRPPPDCQSIS